MVLDSAVFGRGRKLLFRFSAARIFPGVKNRKMPSNNLFWAIAFDSLRSGVPREDSPVQPSRKIAQSKIDSTIER